MRRMLFDDKLAYGARTDNMASTVVWGAIFLKMIAEFRKRALINKIIVGKYFCPALNPRQNI